MTFHRSAYGVFGTSLPANADGYVTYSGARVDACLSALRAGRPLPAWAATGSNPAVARATQGLEAWRESSPS